MKKGYRSFLSPIGEFTASERDRVLVDLYLFH